MRSRRRHTRTPCDGIRCNRCEALLMGKSKRIVLISANECKFHGGDMTPSRMEEGPAEPVIYAFTKVCNNLNGVVFDECYSVKGEFVCEYYAGKSGSVYIKRI